MDYMRNSYGITSVCPYSVRLLPEAPVATPLEWDELKEDKMNARFWTVKNVLKRLSLKGDPWRDFYLHRVDISKHLK